MPNIYYWEKLTFSKLRFPYKENLKKYTSFDEQKSKMYICVNFILALLLSAVFCLQKQVSDFF